MWFLFLRGMGVVLLGAAVVVGRASILGSRKVRVNQRSRLGSGWRENFGGDKRNANIIHKRKEGALVIRVLSTYSTCTSHSHRELTYV